MTTIGIIGCYLRWEMGCPGHNSHRDCFEALNDRKGNFRNIDNPQIVAFASCNGCPGKGIWEKAMMMKEKDNADKIMISSCVYQTPRCQYIDEIVKEIKEKVRIDVIEGSLIPKDEC